MIYLAGGLAFIVGFLVVLVYKQKSDLKIQNKFIKSVLEDKRNITDKYLKSEDTHIFLQNYVERVTPILNTLKNLLEIQDDDIVGSFLEETNSKLINIYNTINSNSSLKKDLEYIVTFKYTLEKENIFLNKNLSDVNHNLKSLFNTLESSDNYILKKHLKDYKDLLKTQKDLFNL